TQIAFYAAGSLEISPGLTVKVDKAVNLIVKQAGSTLSITAADPRQTGLPVTIDASQRLSGPGATTLPGATNPRINFALPPAPLAGSSVTRTFQLINSSITPLASTAAVDQLMGTLKTTV